MNFPQIQIESFRGKIGIDIDKPIQKLEQKSAEISIEQKPAELTIKRDPGTLTIDQTLARENLDLKSIFKRNDENAVLSKQKVMEYINKIVQEGNELMKIENKGQPIIDQAKRSLERTTVFNTGNTPSQFSVKIDYTPSNINIDWKVNEPDIQVQVNQPIHEYTPGKPNIYMEQYPSINIDFKL
ncbi:DUF6470 family protein [Mesobacillus jeotgali]|uniref:DUF6470 family protein n=1 Tax=Mesobacillus jeotgali TaxID=129985 RepID=UPI001CFCA8E8|nr:DUF6470 family protein [Mesobacillus jeotgali]